MVQRPLPDPEASSASPASQTTTKTISSDRRTIHMTLQHKGGVGKSFVANCIAQFYVQQNRPERWLAKFGQSYKWNPCLKLAHKGANQERA